MGNQSGSTFAVCQLGIALGHDADEVRANRLADGSVGCIFCGIAGPTLFEALVQANESIGLRPAFARQQQGTSRYGIGFHYNHVVWGEIRFDALQDFEGDPRSDFGEEYHSPKPEAKLPAAVDNLAQTLARSGFRVVHDQANNSFGHLTFTRRATGAVTVSITWAY